MPNMGIKDSTRGEETMNTPPTIKFQIAPIRNKCL